jgi:hypothetical protein
MFQRVDVRLRNRWKTKRRERRGFRKSIISMHTVQRVRDESILGASLEAMHLRVDNLNTTLDYRFVRMGLLPGTVWVSRQRRRLVFIPLAPFAHSCFMFPWDPLK